MRIAGLLIGLLFTAATLAQSIVTPVFVHKDGDASATGYTGSDKDIVVDGGSQQTVGWIMFQTQGIDVTKIASAKLVLYVNALTSPGTLQVRLLTADITAPENNVRLTGISADVAIAASQALGTTDVEKVIQIDLTAAVKSGTFKGVALMSNDGLATSFDSKEGRLAPVILLTHNVDDVAAKWLSGSDVPANTLGKDGDFYLNNASGDVSARSAGVWNVVTNVVGPAGATGAKGANGDQGIQGIEGPVGTTGVQGLKGDKGDIGLQGATGTAGLPGADGKSIVWRGVWSADSSYLANDAVSYSGSSYISTLASMNKNPADSASYWNTVALKGDTGTPGVAFDDAQALTDKTWSSYKISGELAQKVDTQTGKGLSSEDYTTAEKNKLAAISGTNTGDQNLSNLATNVEVTASLAGKVDIVSGKGLSTKDYTAADSAKLAAVALGTAKGDMQYWNGTKWVRIAAGSADQVLSRVGTDSIPVWRKRPMGSVMDIDGNIYQTVVIGNQEWTLTNLKTTKLNDGTVIPNVTVNTAWAALTTQGYCWYNNDKATNEKYGALYNWYAVGTNKLAPAGWRVPTDADWTALENYLVANGYNYDGTLSGNKIAKSMAAGLFTTIATAGVIGNNLSTNNKSGFSALGGGLRIYNGSFSSQIDGGYWWSATEYGASDAWYRNLGCGNYYLYRVSSYKSSGFSVRLLRDLN